MLRILKLPARDSAQWLRHHFPTCPINVGGEVLRNRFCPENALGTVLVKHHYSGLYFLNQERR